MKNLRIPIALLLSAALYARATEPQGAAEPLKVTLAAGSVVVNGQTVVKLAWSIDEGWIPDSGFRVVRVVAGTNTPLTAQPLKPAAKFATVEAVTLAQRRLSKPMAAQPVKQKESSMAVFEAAATAAKSAATVKRGTNSEAISKAISASPVVAGYFGRLKQKAATQSRSAIAIKKIADPDQETASMRDRLMLSAAFDEELGRDLGLRFTDSQVTKGQTCQYQLRATINGADTTVATATVVVGSDTNSAKPIVATPLQLGQKHVQLHVELPASVPDQLGSLTFDIFRGEAAAKRQLNTEPILPAMIETSDGKLVPALVGFEDKGAPIGRNVYSVVSKDTFGRASEATIVSIDVLDLAGPGASSPVAVIRQNQLSQPNTQKLRVSHQSMVPGPSTVRVIWSPVKAISDDSPFAAGAIVYRVERTDMEATPKQATTLVPTTPGQPANLATVDVRTLCKVRPDIQAWVTAALATALVTSGRGDGTAAPFITDKVYDQKVNVFLQTYQKPLGAAASVELLEYLDNAPTPDKIYTYQLIPILARNQREANTASSGQVGIPATVAPPAPTITQMKDDPAPQTEAGLKSLANGSVANAALMQLSPGIRGAQGAIKENLTANPKQLGSEMLKAGMGKGTAAPSGQKSTTPAKVLVKGGLPVSYGRMVTLTWTQPAYSSKLQYRVFRANGTGFKSGSGLSIVPEGALRASEEQVGQAKPVSGQAKAVVQQGAKIQRTKPSTLPAAAGLGKTAKAFLLDSAPADEDYIELGLTKPGATTFVDLLPASQSSTFYYYLLPTNRWGTTGPQTVRTKVKIKPSLPPSTPALQGAFAQPDGSIQIRVVPNLEIEDVTNYKVMRLEVPVPPAPTTPPAPGPAKPIYATGAKSKTATTYAKSAEGQNLAAVNGGAGATKFGIESHSSPFSSIAANQAQLGVAQISANLSRAFDIASYTVIPAQALGPDANGLLNFKDPSVVPGKYYAYRVVAVNSATLSSEASQFLDAGALKISADPPTLSGAFDAANTRVVLSIGAPASGANAFVVERISTAPGAQWVKLGVIPVAAQFQDTNTLKGRTYRYRVSTIDIAGNLSAPSAEVTVTIP